MEVDCSVGEGINGGTGLSSTSGSTYSTTTSNMMVSVIIPNQVYLSSLVEATDLNELHSHGITHILTVGSGMPALFVNEFSYQLISIEDTPSDLIYLEFEACISFLEHARQQNGKVLVHCEGGVSRSATICAAYLMYLERPFLSASKAIALLQKKRSIVSPNSGFRLQLELLESSGFNFHIPEKEIIALLDDSSKVAAPPPAPPSILNQDLFEIPPEDYGYEIETSSKASHFIPTILEESAFQGMRAKKKKNLGNSTYADDTLLDSQHYHPGADMSKSSSFKIGSAPTVPLDLDDDEGNNNGSDDENDVNFKKKFLAIDRKTKSDHVSKSLRRISAPTQDIDIENFMEKVQAELSQEEGNIFIDDDHHHQGGGDGANNDKDEDELQFDTENDNLEVEKINLNSRGENDDDEQNRNSPHRPKSTSEMMEEKERHRKSIGGRDDEESFQLHHSRNSSTSGDEIVLPNIKEDKRGELKRFRTSSTICTGGTGGGAGESSSEDGDNNIIDMIKKNPETKKKTTPAVSIQGSEHSGSVCDQLAEEEKIAEEEKVAATNVVGKVLLGYQMTPSDQQIVAHWLSQTPEGVSGGRAFRGLRQALKMMRKFVCYPVDAEEEDSSNASCMEGLQHSLKHVSSILETFTGFPLHSSEFMHLLQSNGELDQILLNLEGEFKRALHEVRECTTASGNSSNSDEHDEDDEDDQENEDNVVVGKVEVSEEGKKEPVEATTTTTPDNHEKPTKKKSTKSRKIHRRRRSATIDLLLLLAKLGLRRELNFAISDTAYRQFSHLLEGGQREKATLEDLDESSAIELLGYIETFPKNLKEDERIQRLGYVCKARLILMVEEGTAARICNQLLSQPRITGHVRDVATYAFHFSGALIGTQLGIVRRAKKDVASTKLTAAFRGLQVRKEIQSFKNAAERIQIWRRNMNEDRKEKLRWDMDDDDDDEEEEEDTGSSKKEEPTALDDNNNDNGKEDEDNDEGEVVAELIGSSSNRLLQKLSPRSRNLRSWQSSPQNEKKSFNFIDKKFNTITTPSSGLTNASTMSTSISASASSSKIQRYFLEAIDKANTMESNVASVLSTTKDDSASITKRKMYKDSDAFVRTSDRAIGSLGNRPSRANTSSPSSFLLDDFLSTTSKSRENRKKDRASLSNVSTATENTLKRTSLVTIDDQTSACSTATSLSTHQGFFSGGVSEFSSRGFPTYNQQQQQQQQQQQDEQSSLKRNNSLKPVHALEGLIRHLCRVVMSGAGHNLGDVFSTQQKLRQLQQYSRNLRAVHPQICVADEENRPGLCYLPQASRTLERALKKHPKGYGSNQTPYIYDFELEVLAFFPPCEFDTALQPPEDTSAAFRKILSTVFELMPCDEEALLDLTETATLSQHASAGYAITTVLHYIDKACNTDYLQTHHLGDERDSRGGTVAAGYVRYDEETGKYVFTEESGHYGLRWTIPGTRQSFDKFMRQSNLQDDYLLKPFYRKANPNEVKNLSSLFDEGENKSSKDDDDDDDDQLLPSPPSLDNLGSNNNEQQEEELLNSNVNDDDDEWDFDDD